MWQTVSGNLFYSYAHTLLLWLPNVLCIHSNPIEFNRNSSYSTVLKIQVTQIWDIASSTRDIFRKVHVFPVPLVNSELRFNANTMNGNEAALANITTSTRLVSAAPQGLHLPLEGLVCPSDLSGYPWSWRSCQLQLTQDWKWGLFLLSKSPIPWGWCALGQSTIS